MQNHSSLLRSLAALSCVALGALGTQQAHAQTTIDQNRVLAGNVTPGDTAGFPVTISQPGSYKLTSNLYVPTGSTGIFVTADNVSIDLNGFAIIGTTTCSKDPATYAVTCSDAKANAAAIWGKAVTRLSVKNGAITGHPGAGIWAHLELVVESVRFSDIGMIAVAAETAAVSNSSAKLASTAFSVSSSGLITNCMVDSAGTAFSASGLVLISNSVATKSAIGAFAGSLHGVNLWNNKINSTATVSMGNNMANGVAF